MEEDCVSSSCLCGQHVHYPAGHRYTWCTLFITLQGTGTRGVHWSHHNQQGFQISLKKVVTDPEGDCGP